LDVAGRGQLNGGNYTPNLTDNGTFLYDSTNGLNMLGVISGSGGLTLNSGVLTLGAGGANGETFTGPTVVNGGTLQLNYNNPSLGGLNTSSSLTINKGGRVAALWSSANSGYSAAIGVLPMTINAGGVFDVSPLNTVSGSGFSGHITGVVNMNGGAISNNAAYFQQYGGWYMQNTINVNGGTNTSIIADPEFVPAQTGGLILNVTAGSNQTIPGIDLEVSGAFASTWGNNDTGFILMGNGVMRMDGRNTSTNGTISTMTVSNGATLILGVNGQFNSLNKSNSFANTPAAANVQNGQQGGTVYTGIFTQSFTNNGTFICTANPISGQTQTFSGLVTGSGQIQVSGTGAAMILSGSNTFAGSILVANNGTLKIANTNGSGTGTGSLNISSGGTLGGSGIISGFVTNNANGNLIPGIGAGGAATVLTVSNLTMLAGSTNTFAVSHGNINDKVVAQSVSYGGTLTVTSANAAALAAGDTFQLFSASTSYGLSSFANVILPALSSGLTWNTSNLAVNGTISVASVVSTAPTFGSVRLSGGNLIMSGANGTPSAQYRILTSTNVALPLINWTPVVTNVFASDGSYSYTNTAATNNAGFFILVSP
jgi:hypothetical protein